MSASPCPLSTASIQHRSPQNRLEQPLISRWTLTILLSGGDPERAKKIVLIAGPLDSHPRETHEYEKNIFLLKHCLESLARVEVHLNGWPADPAALDDADTIFMTSGGCDRRLEDHPLYLPGRLELLEKQMKRGCGIVFHHWSTFHPRAHHDRITEWVGGYFDYESGPPPRKWFSKIETKEFMTAIGSPDHPIARGLRPFKLREEFYFNLKFRDEDPRLRPILLRAAGGDLRSDTVGWAVERADGGRGFGFTGGHFYANWWIPEFRKLVLNAIAWTAKIEIPEGGVESTLEGPARALIVTGHNHPAHDWSSVTVALLQALEQDPRIRVDVTENPEDLAAAKADLLVMNYNNWDRPGLSDAAKAGFLRHLAEGRGAALIHFANGAFNSTLPNKESDWEEYRTKISRRSWMHPESAHDNFGPFRVEIAKHPITEGLASFDTMDELYFKQSGMEPIAPFASARSKVTGKDEPLAWAGEYGKGRLFQTLLGHSDHSVRKAAALIRRGCAWAAGLTPLGFDPPLEPLEKATFRSGSPWKPKPPSPPAPVQESDPVKTQKEKDWVDDRWNQMVLGPFMTSTISPPGGHALKAISIRLGENDEAALCFETKDLSLRAGWTGGFLQFNPARFGLIGMPKPAGPIQFSLPAGPAWDAEGRYGGLHVNGRRVVLSYTLDDTAILDSPWIETHEGITAFTRTIEVGPGAARTLALFQRSGGRGRIETREGVALALHEEGDQTWAAASLEKVGFEISPKGEAKLQIPAREGRARVKILLWKGATADLDKFVALARRRAPPEDLRELQKPGPPRWPQIGVRGMRGAGKEPYVVDTIPVPFDNPWKALIFAAGIDFFPNGDAAVCTAHGDVWIVRGLDDPLEKVTWKRFATGLFQALGLRIVKERVHVLGRDQITILHDLNGDDEADRYECFTNLIPTSPGGHDYVTSLDTDAEGNFYHMSPRGVHRIPPDGSRHETIAAGWRNPNGMSVGPDGTITVAPQEGEWTPSSQICEVKPGGWYGYGGPKVTPERPLGVDPPLCWIPRAIDNSTGDQVWVTSDRWGPLKGQLLNLAWGRCTLQLVLRESVEGRPQGGVVPTNLQFSAGVARGRFSPRDGQLYVVGLRGWQTSGVHDGCLQRVRYTGARVPWPVGMNVHADGLKITFLEPVDRDLAQDGDSWAVERWNYRYERTYGSKDWSVKNPDQEGRDPMAVKSVRVLEDGRGVFLEIPDLAPVMQMRVRYNLGPGRKGEIAHTIHSLGPAFKR